MQVYYFTRTGRSKIIAQQLAERHNTEARIIDDHKDWSGKVNYMKAGAMAMSGKIIPVDYEKPDLSDEIVVVFPLWAGTMPPAVKAFITEVGGKNVIAIVTSLGSKLSNRDEFKNVIDLVGKEISLPTNL